MLNLVQHPSLGTLHAMPFERDPSVCVLASGSHGRFHVGLTSNLIERDNPDWADLAVGLRFAPLAPRGGKNGS